MKDQAIEKLDKLKKKITDGEVKVTSIREENTDDNSGKTQISYKENNSNSNSIGF